MLSMGGQGLIPEPHGVYSPLGVIPAYLSVAPNSASTLPQKSITQELRIKPENVFFSTFPGELVQVVEERLSK